MVSFSVIIITQGREELLSKCLHSLSGIEHNWQLILVSNGEELSLKSLDLARNLTPHFSLLNLIETLTPGMARNRALEVAEGEWIHLLDDDAFWGQHYKEIIFPLLQDPAMEVLGGPDFPAPGMSPFATSVAIALSSPFCTGTTFSRHRSLGKKMTSADEEQLSSCNLWVRRNILSSRPFPEDYKRGEETIFLQVLKQSGHRLIYHPRLQVAHFRRTKLKTMMRPSFFAGYYRSRVIREKLTSGAEAFWLPSLFVLLHLLIFIEPMAFWSLAKLYLALIVSVSLGLSAKAGKIWLFPLVSFFHYFIVFTYGLGFMAERLRFKWK